MRKPEGASSPGRGQRKRQGVTGHGGAQRTGEPTRDETLKLLRKNRQRSGETSAHRSELSGRNSNPLAAGYPNRNNSQSSGRERRKTERQAHKDKERSQRVSEGKSFVLGGLEVSVRLLVASMLGVILAILLIPNVVAWWNQEREYRDIQAKVAAAQERNAEMTRELQRWQDPEYIASQARDRLGYVRRGETQYTVVDPGDDYQDQAQVNAAAEKGPARPWIQLLGIYLEEADQPVDDAQSSAGAETAAQSGERVDQPTEGEGGPSTR